ncbi:MAG: hypothetical protein ACREFP_01520 [Acetobacteraceae bacterium]
MIRRLTTQGGNFSPSYEVEYCNGSSLIVPVAATEWEDSSKDQTKLSIIALQELVSVVESLESYEYSSKRALDDSAARAAASGRRRRRHNPGGGPT